MTKEKIAIAAIGIVLGTCLVFANMSSEPADAIEASEFVSAPAEYVGPTVVTDYDQDTIVPAHDAVCRYCNEVHHCGERRFGLYRRFENQLTGVYAHVHRCPSCNERYICGFQCTMSDGPRERAEVGLKSREGGE